MTCNQKQEKNWIIISCLRELSLCWWRIKVVFCSLNRSRNSQIRCSENIRKFLGKSLRLALILIKLQKLEVYEKYSQQEVEKRENGHWIPFYFTNLKQSYIKFIDFRWRIFLLVWNFLLIDPLRRLFSNLREFQPLSKCFELSWCDTTFCSSI